MMSEKDRPSLPEWIDGLQECGRYTFTHAEAENAVRLHGSSLAKALQRAVKAKRIQHVRQGFYGVIPLEHRAAGGVPADWYIDALMSHVGMPYHIGVLSAAALHGAAHQQPQVFQVVVPESLRPVRSGRSRIVFFRNRHFAQALTERRKSYTGTICVSTPEWTALDLFRYQRRIGSLDTIATVLAELSESMDATRLVEACRRDSQRSCAQRLGWMLEHLGQRELAAPAAEWMREEKPSKVRLDPQGSFRGSAFDPTWRVTVNANPESEI